MFIHQLKTLVRVAQRLKDLSLLPLELAERRGLWALFLYAVVGSIILPIPIDSILTGLIIGSPRRWLRLTVAFASASVVGGLATYGIGYQCINLLGNHLIGWCGGELAWLEMVKLFQSGR